MTTFEEVRTVLKDCLQLGSRAAALEPATPLLGSLPELDSMAVLTVLTALEERFGIAVEDDDISAENFATVASLCEYVDQKRAA